MSKDDRPSDNSITFFEHEIGNMSGCGIATLSLLFPPVAIVFGFGGMKICKEEKGRAASRALFMRGCAYLVLDTVLLLWLMHASRIL